MEDGKDKKGNQHFYCHKKFSTITGLLLSYSKKSPAQWHTYMDSLFRRDSLEQSAAIAGICGYTAFVWRHKILSICATLTDEQKLLSGIVYLDDKLVDVRHPGILETEPKVVKRGISDQKRNIACAVDEHGNFLTEETTNRKNFEKLVALNYANLGGVYGQVRDGSGGKELRDTLERLVSLDALFTALLFETTGNMYTQNISMKIDSISYTEDGDFYSYSRNIKYGYLDSSRNPIFHQDSKQITPEVLRTQIEKKGYEFERKMLEIQNNKNKAFKDFAVFFVTNLITKIPTGLALKATISGLMTAKSYITALLNLTEDLDKVEKLEDKA